MTGRYFIRLQLICDVCGSDGIFDRTYIGHVWREDLVNDAREAGWSVGKYQICPSCREHGYTWRDAKRLKVQEAEE